MVLRSSHYTFNYEWDMLGKSGDRKSLLVESKAQTVEISKEELKEMIEWLMKVQPPGWLEFLKMLLGGLK